MDGDDAGRELAAKVVVAGQKQAAVGGQRDGWANIAQRLSEEDERYIAPALGKDCCCCCGCVIGSDGGDENKCRSQKSELQWNARVVEWSLDDGRLHCIGNNSKVTISYSL